MRTAPWLLVVVLVASACGTDERAAELCNRLDTDRFSNPAYLAVQTYGPGEFAQAAEDVFDECPRHAAVAGYYQRTANFRTGDDLQVPPGYGLQYPR